MFVVCWRPCVALTGGVEYDAICKWPGVPSRPFGASGTLHTSFGAVVETSAGLPVDGTRIGDKPRLGTCVVSQVVVYTHVGFCLKSAEHMSCADAKWWKHV